MPKIVDHDARRRELAGAVQRVIARDGVAQVSIRTVAAESGWSSGALRHYFATRDELLAFACEQMIEQVTERIVAMPTDGPTPAVVRRILLETMPVDEQRYTEAAIGFAFLALGLSDPALARVQRLTFTRMANLCRQLTDALTPDADEAARRSLARRMHVVVDGLTVHVLVGHLTAPEMIAELDTFLSEAVGVNPRTP
ncbi:TetR family transcriptional regulator [Actinoplanes sp. SE50]|uniref:TetR/AcrR family transcriptional regulator n=1 Tax=unclassified Actinoplanes TaxID=2626549 RepID=UPI00023ECDE9|nr:MULTISPECIES: TetR/AcrR family transcriptional regulator [unclassified Actinoplanes]AEV82097.1 HTH-type transcriptional regulator betI [Actinoplanes sp. SE50/110]ATO80496.1 TetR family transcriptional regulator [Actinoplanes sp. SE50]SLL97903.1 TetR family transcriptional regulator [Actinoplanes sp. SE50/110]